MDFRNERLSIEKAKEIDMVLYLSSLGFDAIKVRGHNHWYFSPFRAENNPSFKVNSKLNRWYDFGIGKGGSIIDFGLVYFNSSSIPEILQILSGNLSLPQHTYIQTLKHPLQAENKVEVLSEHPITSYSLVRYLDKRKIPLAIAEKFCNELRFRQSEETWYGLGFRNDQGGYEIRNEFYKGSSSPKSVTTISNGAQDISVFEGFFDLLSFEAIRPSPLQAPTDYLVLNSLSFFEKALSELEKYKGIHLFLDNDPPGQKCSRSALSIDKRLIDESRLYAGHKDLNDLLKSRSAQNKTRRLRRGHSP